MLDSDSDLVPCSRYGVGARGVCGLVERTWRTGVEDADEGRGDEWDIDTVALDLE